MMARRSVRIALLLPFVVACSQPGEGALQPLAGPGIALVQRSSPGDTAGISVGQVSARVWGDWGSDAGETVDIEYRNAGTVPVDIRVDRVRIAFGEATGPVEQISDVSRVDLDDADHRNDVGRSLMADAQAPDLPGVVRIPAGGVRRVQVSFAPFADGARPRADDVLTLSVPMPSTPVVLRLRCAGP